MKFSNLLIAWASFAGLVQAVLDNYTLFNNGNAFWTAQLKTMVVPPSSYAKRAWGTAPEHCVKDAVNNRFCNPYNIEVYDITYSDCAIPWTVCRCSNAPMTIQTIINNIGRLSVRARSWVRHYSFYAPSSVAPYSGYAAYSDYIDINVLGNYTDSTLLWHETGHNLDFWQAGSGKVYSAESEWQTLATADSCMVTAYSKASWQEDFAEVSVSATFEENIDPIPLDTECWSNQLNTSRSILRPAIKIIPGDQCENRLVASTDVCMGQEARDSGACNEVPDAMLKRSVDGKQPTFLHENGLNPARYTVKREVKMWETGIAEGLPIIEQIREAQDYMDAKIAKRFAERAFIV